MAGVKLLPHILAIMSFGNENSSDRYGVSEWLREQEVAILDKDEEYLLL